MFSHTSPRPLHMGKAQCSKCYKIDQLISISLRIILRDIDKDYARTAFWWDGWRSLNFEMGSGVGFSFLPFIEKKGAKFA